MKRVILHTTMAITLLATLHLCSATVTRAQEEAGCSSASVAGKWGFTTNGTVVDIGPRDSVGIFTLDGTGKLVNGKATASLNGTVTEETFSGTYSVSPDCTGKLSIEIFDQSGNEILAATLNLVFDEDVREMRALFTSATLPNGAPLGTVISVQAKRVRSGPRL
jgi:hypothetical protein